MRDGGLEGAAAVWVVEGAVRGEDLAEAEEGGAGGVAEEDVVGAEAPAEVCGAVEEGVLEGQDAPDQGVIKAAQGAS